jgi:hypothetical protein
MEILRSGLLELGENLWPVIAFLITCSGLGLFTLQIFSILRKLPRFLKFVISLPLGVIPLSLFSFLFIQLARTWGPSLTVGSIFLLCTGFGAFVFYFIRWKLWKSSLKTWLAITACLLGFTVLTVLRLAYNHNLVVPPYHDSVEHYRILTGFLTPVTTPPLFSGTYYHSGFHSVGAWLVKITRITSVRAILLLGQLLLTLVPFSLFALVFAVTRRWKESLAVALVGTTFWQMPAYGINWGKYPALAANIILPVILAVLFVLIKDKTSRTRVRQSILVFLGATVGIVFLHSRALFCLLIGTGVILLDHLLVSKATLLLKRILAFIATLAIFLILFLSPWLRWTYAIPVTPIIVAVVASLFSTWSSPRLSFSTHLAAILIFLLIEIPVPSVFHLDSRYWLDGPFYNTFLFIPLSISTGIGLAYIYEKAVLFKWVKPIAITAMGCLLIYAVISQPYRPDRCCNFVNEDDLAVIEWIGQNVPEQAEIAIPGRTEIYPQSGTDAGIWITVLTGKRSFLHPSEYEWFAEPNHRAICSRGGVYLFSGSFPLSFQINDTTHPDWYEVVFRKGDTTVYHVIGCAK